MTEKPTNLDLLLELDKLAEKLGRAPTKAVMHGQGDYSPQQYIDRFGSWQEALEAAGVDPTQENRRGEAELIFDQETIDAVEELLDENDDEAFLRGQLLAELMRLRIDLRRSPTLQDVSKFGELSPSSYVSQFDSWNNALQQLDLELNEHPYKDVTDTELLEELHHLEDELGEVPTIDDMNEHGKYSAPMYYTRFGSWTEALQLAGIKQSSNGH